MPLSIQVVVDTDIPVESLNDLSKSLTLFREAFNSIGKELTSYFGNQVFDSEGGILGERWEPLSEAYRNYKATGHTVLDPQRWRDKNDGEGAQVYPGRGILERTGEMRKSFTFDADDNSLTVGNTAEHFVYHQSNEERNKIPRRAMMALNDDVKTIIADIINADIREKLAKAGFNAG